MGWMGRCVQCGGTGQTRVVGRAAVFCHCLIGQELQQRHEELEHARRLLAEFEKLAERNLRHVPVNGNRAKRGKDGR